jgi:hypothetical protein
MGVHFSACRNWRSSSMTPRLVSTKVKQKNCTIKLLIEMPRQTSKILSTAKKPQTTATALIGEFDRKGFTGAGDTYLRKVDKKELSK